MDINAEAAESAEQMNSENSAIFLCVSSVFSGFALNDQKKR